MKKYRICLFLFLGVSLVCVLIAFFVRRNWENSGAVDTPETAIERDTVPELSLIHISSIPVWVWNV